MILQHVLSLVNAGYTKAEITAMEETKQEETKQETKQEETKQETKQEETKQETKQEETKSEKFDYAKLAQAIVKAQKEDAFHTDHSGGVPKQTDLGQFF